MAQRPLIVNLYIQSKFTLRSIQQSRMGIRAFRIKKRKLHCSLLARRKNMCAQCILYTHGFSLLLGKALLNFFGGEAEGIAKRKLRCTAEKKGI